MTTQYQVDTSWKPIRLEKGKYNISTEQSNGVYYFSENEDGENATIINKNAFVELDLPKTIFVKSTNKQGVITISDFFFDKLISSGGGDTPPSGDGLKPENFNATDFEYSSASKIMSLNKKPDGYLIQNIFNPLNSRINQSATKDELQKVDDKITPLTQWKNEKEALYNGYDDRINNKASKDDLEQTNLKVSENENNITQLNLEVGKKLNKDEFNSTIRNYPTTSQVNDLITPIDEKANKNASDIVDIQNNLVALSSGIRLIGGINKNYQEVIADKDNILNAFVQEKKQRAPKEGDLIWTLDNYIFLYLNETGWTDGRKADIPLATTETPGIIKLKNELFYLINDGLDGTVKVAGSEQIALKSEVTQQINSTQQALQANIDLKADKTQLENFYNKGEVDLKLSKKLDIETYNSDKEGFATKDELNLKANNNEVVHLTGDEIIDGKKTFKKSLILDNNANYIEGYGALRVIAEQNQKSYLSFGENNNSWGWFTLGKTDPENTADIKFISTLNNKFNFYRPVIYNENFELTDDKMLVYKKFLMDAIANFITKEVDNLTNYYNKTQADNTFMDLTSTQDASGEKRFLNTAVFRGTTRGFGNLKIERPENEAVYFSLGNQTNNSAIALFGFLASSSNIFTFDNKKSDGSFKFLQKVTYEGVINDNKQLITKEHVDNNFVTIATQQNITGKKFVLDKFYLKNSPNNVNYGQFIIVDENTDNKRAFITFAKNTADSVANLYGKIGIIGGDLQLFVADNTKSILANVAIKYSSELILTDDLQLVHKKYVDTATQQISTELDDVKRTAESNSQSISSNTQNIATLNNEIGTLSNLNTTNKSNLVASINEVNSKFNVKKLEAGQSPTAGDIPNGTFLFVVY